MPRHRKKLLLPFIEAEGNLSVSQIAGQLFVARSALENAAANIEDLVKGLDEERQVVDDAAFVVEKLLDKLDPGQTQRRGRARKRSQEQQVLGPAEAMKLELMELPDGGVRVRIDARSWFRLPAKLGALLAIISEPTSTPGEDGFLGWRRYDEVAARLTKRTGRTQSADTLTKQISKLRAAFRDAGENESLVETDHHRAVRFRLRAPNLEPLAPA